jgi:hypothetical protein
MFKKCQNHLVSVNESYFHHLCFAFYFGSRMIGAGMAVILHGLLPAVFERTGSQTIFALNDELKARIQGHDSHTHG